VAVGKKAERFGEIVIQRLSYSKRHAVETFNPRAELSSGYAARSDRRRASGS
jgi:hypothetical protein